ncbi:acyl-CoA dehydrogenase [Microbacterium sorbitolivorans]|uniref:Acyl-CoA dehydrogenase n=1 Tax=Microbacterium sorbitolivorans TaxID=1867410 RepID=A0A367Y2S2_9MICO|nr:acyl-CoA dehydrogenase family protein [Microbacterium sorbitolivorans]RCK60127.1 acyl-CoA dehydrogenase [Microbacterium sorbitolivorans]GGF48028.1 acyl-CoA dehydrogenase [Microbacterium sorbitolivorans]
MSAIFDPSLALPSDLLERIRERAPEFDRDNVFPEKDLAELADAGYLRILLPTDRGGSGATLEQASAAQQRLATAAPATALAINMHLVWTAVARILHERGDDALGLVVEGAARGEVFAFGVSEAGNDAVMFDSRTTAERTDDGYAFTGTKIFTSLAPVWTLLGVHGRDDSDPENPKIVFGFVGRDENVVTRDDWDALGMRGSQSRTTELHGALAPADRVVKVIDMVDIPDGLQFAIFAAFELLVASVYTGIARRAIELAAAAVAARVSSASGTPRSEDPVVRDRIGDMALAYDGIVLELRALTRDVDEQVDHGAAWFPLLSGMKDRATATAQRIVDDALALAGGGSFRNASELSRLARDVRAGVFHPTSPRATRQQAAAAWLDA